MIPLNTEYIKLLLRRELYFFAIRTFSLYKPE